MKNFVVLLIEACFQLYNNLEGSVVLAFAEILNQPQLSIAVKPKDINHFLLKDTSFANLMQMRIYNVLLIARKYEAFMLEDDSRIDEKIFLEYVSLNLRYPPRFTLVVDENEALVELNARNYDLVIVMPGSDNFDIFSGAKRIKEQPRPGPGCRCHSGRRNGCTA